MLFVFGPPFPFPLGEIGDGPFGDLGTGLAPAEFRDKIDKADAGMPGDCLGTGLADIRGLVCAVYMVRAHPRPPRPMLLQEDPAGRRQ